MHKAFALLLSLTTPATAQEIAVAGSPVATIADGDFDRLFSSLAEAGVTTYFPTFQYEEVPAPQTLGYETAFVAPCTPDAPAFAAARAQGIKLILPGEFLYPDPARIAATPLSEDPLAQTLACAGRDQIAGITNYDEAVLNGLPFEAVETLYARVKAIDPTLPVLMVHGPLLTDRQIDAQTYLTEVQRYSEAADITGFDIYPVPAQIAKLATPLSAEITGPDQAVADYMRWLRDTLPHKRHLAVLQGFAYTDLYAADYLTENVPAELLAQIKAPTPAELATMTAQAHNGGAELIIFWGPSLLSDAQSPPWPALLDLQ